ncbi:hypothetical protein QR680_005377 [Steinernema hermaphroditum]|uniref:Ig-like domain-containing protein n=1 Tax=Steinernema hermaphroditum TaxID=289476 RepID=A0AA39LUQ5_9BILA|nr:hypothetical protein QR680_005377 [Steinernema hermaphroditum]
MDEEPTTTTISTIAIRAGDRAEIVCTFLKSIGYVQLRIDEMRPRLLEIGDTLDDTANLVDIHEGLMKRLKSKESQVEELLARADHLVTEQKDSDIVVYEAMAESLGNAWKELNRQLQMRGYLLADVRKFYDLASHHQKISTFISQQLKSQAPSYALQLKRSVNDLLDITALAVDTGSSIITQLRVLGSLADNPERACETVNACLQIEKVMLRMSEEWTSVEDVWRDVKGRVEEVEAVVGRFADQLREVEKWLSTAKGRLASPTGNTLLDQLTQESQQKRTELSRISTALQKESSSAGAQLSGQCAILQNDLENFIRLLEERQNTSQRLLHFFQLVDSMMNQLSKMETDMLNANGAMAGELAPLAHQKANAVIDEGKLLLPDAAVAQKLQQIQAKLAELDALAQQRIAARSEHLRREISSLDQWLRTSAESFLLAHGRMGRNLTEATEFLEQHRSFSTQITNKEPEVVAVLNRSRELSSQERSRLVEFQQQYENLKQTLERRVQVGTTFQQVHRFARELEGSFDSLSALLDTNRDFSNEKVAGQMVNVFQMIQETLTQERHQGEKFISTAKSVGVGDAHLNVGEAVDSVREVLSDHERRFVAVTDKWQKWQRSRSESRKNVQVVEEIQMWQVETVEIVRLLEDKVANVKTKEEVEDIRQKLTKVVERMPEQLRKMQEAKRVTQETEDIEASEKLMRTEQRQQEITARVKALQQQIITVTETLTIEHVTENAHPPTIVTALRDSQVEEGARFEFAARVEGEPEPRLTWTKDGLDVRENADYRTAYVNGVATLTIEETFVEDTAVYTIRAENAAGAAESSAKLVVKSRSALGSQIEEAEKPRFVKQLQNVTVTEGGISRLDCVLVARPEPEVMWFKEEEAVKETERVKLQFRGDHCSLTIADTVISDAGLYKVKAQNVHGESTNFCKLSVTPRPQTPKIPPPTPPKPKVMPLPVAPSFEPALANQTLLAGQRAMLQVRTLGEPEPVVSWKFNERKVESLESLQLIFEDSGWSRLVIDSVGPQHAGMYTVEAINESGEARTGATLVVHEVSVPRTTVTTVHSVHEGYWTDGALSATQTPPPIPKHRFETTEEFAEREASEVGFSMLATAPEFIRQFQSEYTIEEGEKIQIDCLMVGNPRPKVHWYFNDRPINTNYHFCEFLNIGDTYSIYFNPAKLENAGYYKIKAENCRGRCESETMVHVRPRSLIPQPKMRTKKPHTMQHQHVEEEFGAYEYEQRRPATKQPLHSGPATPPPAKKQHQLTHRQDQEYLEQYDLNERKVTGHPPHFTQTLVSCVAEQGGFARFEGVVTGWPAPDVQWTKDGVAIDRATHPDIEFSNIGGRVSLSFGAALPGHAGKYMCTARNASGVATSSAQLVVRPKTIAPDFVQRLISEEIAEGERLKWVVRITGDPPPTVTWLRDGQVIPNCQEVRLVDEGQGIHSMVIEKAEIADCGQFTCLAENLAGEARSTADLVVRPAGTDPGNYFHITKMTQEKQVKGEEVTRNQTFSIENPRTTPMRS